MHGLQTFDVYMQTVATFMSWILMGHNIRGIQRVGITPQGWLSSVIPIIQ